MKKIIVFVLLGFVSFGIGAEEPAALRFAKIIGDHMVLQQEKPIRIWGWAKPGSEVSVSIDLQEPMDEEAGTEYKVTMQYVESNPPPFTSETVKTKAGKDGRWVAVFKPLKASFQPKRIAAVSGELGVMVDHVLIGEIWVCAGQSNMGWSNFNRKDREAASADFPGLRYVAWHDSWYKPLEDIRNNVNWQVCSPEAAQRFSAVPYLFGMFLHRYLKVPVGIVNVARGGTLGQTWCLREELDGLDHVTVKSALATYDAETARWDNPDEVKKIMAEWEQACEVKKAEHETKTAQAKADHKKPPRLRLPKKPGDARSGWSPPAGLFNATILPIRDLRIRGVLYYQGENNNFMRWTQYEYTFPKVPVSFRKAFGEEDLPFGCISQPGWGNFGMDPEVATVAEGYAIVRDIQRRALKDDPHGDMIATYPTGNSYIHPAEKLPVADYASLWALAKVYGEPVVHRANEYQDMKKKEDKIYLYFDADPVVYERWKHIENNAYWQVLPMPREGNAELRGFIVAGKDRRWYPAKARHTRFEKVPCIEVWSDLVPDPVAVRYGWANWPTGNLVGRARLPLPTFRTDDWPIPEGVSYSEDAKKAASENLSQLKEQGAKDALDRKVRQMQIDLPKLESDLFKGDAPGAIHSKLDRIKRILDELEDDRGLGRSIEREYAAFGEQLKAFREQFEKLNAQAEAGREK